MLIKLVVIFCAVFSIYALSGCDKIKSVVSSDVSIVKKGTLEFDKSLTVGQAIDNYKYFKKTKWESVTTDNGRKVVEVIADINTETSPTFNEKVGIKSMFMKFQFKINQDQTFELAYCGAGVEKTDGSKIDPPDTINLNACFNTMKSIYNNESSI